MPHALRYSTVFVLAFCLAAPALGARVESAEVAIDGLT